MKPGSIIRTVDKKAIRGMAPSSGGKFSAVGEITITIFWGCEGMIVVDLMLRGETVNSDTYIRTLSELGKCFK
jgi:hypothetical protein